MTTNDWTERLSDYLDGTLTPEERSACDAWLASNSGAQALLADLRGVVAKAKTLPDAPVPESVWAGVSAAIRKPDAAVVPIESARRPAVSALRRWQFTPLQLAAAAAILLAIGLGIGVRIKAGVKQEVAGNTPQAEGPFIHVGRTPGADAKYDEAIRELRATLEQNRATMDTATVRVLESSLAKVDTALAQAQRALDDDPNSEYLNDHLSRIKRKKLDLLRQGAALVQAS